VRVALTGAPGTGKTTLAALLAPTFLVHAVRDLAEACGALGPLEGDGAHLVDLDALHQHVQSLPPDVLIEGHLSHHLHPDVIVVLRCTPETLRDRLEARGYGPDKVRANVEWEMLGGVHAEVQDAGLDVPMLELDASSMTPEGMAERICAWKDAGYAASSEAFIDWLADATHPLS
jgi:adenylate kinase